MLAAAFRHQSIHDVSFSSFPFSCPTWSLFSSRYEETDWGASCFATAQSHQKNCYAQNCYAHTFLGTEWLCDGPNIENAKPDPHYALTHHTHNPHTITACTPHHTHHTHQPTHKPHTPLTPRTHSHTQQPHTPHTTPHTHNTLHSRPSLRGLKPATFKTIIRGDGFRPPFGQTGWNREAKNRKGGNKQPNTVLEFSNCRIVDLLNLWFLCISVFDFWISDSLMFELWLFVFFDSPNFHKLNQSGPPRSTHSHRTAAWQDCGG